MKLLNELQHCGMEQQSVQCNVPGYFILSPFKIPCILIKTRLQHSNMNSPPCHSPFSLIVCHSNFEHHKFFGSVHLDFWCHHPCPWPPQERGACLSLCLKVGRLQAGRYIQIGSKGGHQPWRPINANCTWQRIFRNPSSNKQAQPLSLPQSSIHSSAHIQGPTNFAKSSCNIGNEGARALYCKELDLENEGSSSHSP